MAKEITDLQDQIAELNARRGALTFTDDEGRVIGGDDPVQLDQAGRLPR